MEKLNLISEAVLDKEIHASVDNPTLTKLSFIFTDNQPNGNKKGIPTNSFSSIINTGKYMPIKMAEGGIGIDHEGAMPLGTITDLTQKKLSDSVDQVVGEAVLWKNEREEDVNFVKSAFASGEKVNVSWEILYSNSQTDNNGIEWILDPIVKAVTFVGLPAYQGRTMVLDMASQNLPDNYFLHIEPSEGNDGTKKYFPYKDADGNLSLELLVSAVEDISNSEFSNKDELLERANKLIEAADWTTAYKNNLPDSAFLYIEPGGKKDSEGKTVPRSLRHLPYKDANGKVDRAHLINAKQRLPQTQGIPASEKARIASKIDNLLKNQGQSSMTEEELRKLLKEKMKNPDMAKMMGGKDPETMGMEEMQNMLDRMNRKSNSSLEDLEARVSDLEKQLQDKETELAALREFKSSIEKKEAEAALLKTRLDAFAAAELSFTPDEIEAKKVNWLKMDDEQFNYFVDELKSRKVANSSLNQNLPDRLSQSNDKDMLEIVRQGLKEFGKK